MAAAELTDQSTPNGNGHSALVANDPPRVGGLANLVNQLPAPVTRFLERFKTLTGSQQVALMVGLAATVALVVSAMLWSRPNPTPYQTLYNGLAEADTAQIVEALQKAHIGYRIDPETGALTVPGTEIHSTRIKLAGMGLPKTAPIGGFELLDNQSPFGTSQFMEGARYQRALEGELAHSILTMSAIQSARVHLAMPRPSVFLRDREKPSAAVVVQLHSGRYLDRGQVDAIVHLVASSIPELDPTRVSVVDQSGDLLTKQDSKTQALDLTNAQFDHVRRVEESYTKRIEEILTPLAGPNGVRAQVSLDMDFSDTEQTKEIYNPDQPALRSEQTAEEQTTGPTESGIPGALSNQPPAAGTVPQTLNNGAAPPEAGQGVTAQSQKNTTPLTTKRHATRNYEVDHTISHSHSQVGQIRRISVAVIMDDAVRTDLNPPQRIARSPEEMERIRALVREAVGYDTQRGDSVSVVNLSFKPDFGREGSIETPWWREPWAVDMLRQGLAALFVLLLILGILRPVMRRMVAEVGEEKHAPPPPPPPEEEELRELMPAGEGASEEESEPPEDQLNLSHKATPWLDAPQHDYESSLDHVRFLIKEEPKMVSEILRDWILADQAGGKEKN